MKGEDKINEASPEMNLKQNTSKPDDTAFENILHRVNITETPQDLMNPSESLSKRRGDVNQL